MQAVQQLATFHQLLRIRTNSISRINAHLPTTPSINHSQSPMNLLSLSDELLLQILMGDTPLDSIDTETIEALSYTCHRLHAIATTVRSRIVRCYPPCIWYGPPSFDAYWAYKTRFERDVDGSRARLVSHASFKSDSSTANTWDMMGAILSRLDQLQELRILIGSGRQNRQSSNIFAEWSLLHWPLNEERNFLTLLRQSSRFGSLHTVLVEDEGICADEILAFCALPVIECLQIIGFKGQMLPITTVTTPALAHSHLKCLTMLSDVIPTGPSVDYIFKFLSKLNNLSWTTQKERLFTGNVTRRDWASRDIQIALLPCRRSLRRLDVLIKDRQHLQLPVFDFCEFECLESIRVSSLIIFPRAGYSSIHCQTDGFGEHLPKSLVDLEVCRVC